MEVTKGITPKCQYLTLQTCCRHQPVEDNTFFSPTSSSEEMPWCLLFVWTYTAIHSLINPSPYTAFQPLSHFHTFPSAQPPFCLPIWHSTSISPRTHPYNNPSAFHLSTFLQLHIRPTCWIDLSIHLCPLPIHAPAHLCHFTHSFSVHRQIICGDNPLPWIEFQLSWWIHGWWWAPRLEDDPSSSPVLHNGSQTAGSDDTFQEMRCQKTGQLERGRRRRGDSGLLFIHVSAFCIGKSKKGKQSSVHSQGKHALRTAELF